MKKIFYSACAVLGILATGCNSDNESENIQPQSNNVSIIATLPEASKTTLSDDGNYGFSVAWEAGDVLTVSDGIDNKRWDYNWSSSNEFIPTTSGSYKDGIVAGTYAKLWAMHCRSDQRAYVKNRTHKLLSEQTQSADDNTDHIKDLQCLFGEVSNITLPGTTPVFSMSPIYSIIHVKVVNNSTKIAKVSQIKFEAPVNIAGISTIADDGTSSVTSQESKSITLNISADVAIGATLHAYILTSPVSLDGTATMTVTANGTNVSKTLGTLNMKAGTTYKTTVTITSLPDPSTNPTSLTEDFSSITTGNSTASSGSNTAWTGNENFPESGLVKAYKAGGAVRIGSKDAIGSITSKALDLSAPFVVKIKVKGWTKVEGDLTVTVGSETQTITYTQTIADAFGEYTLNFAAATTSSTVKIATTAKRAFIDEVQIYPQ